MNEYILILIAGLIAMCIGLPVVTAYDKWKKIMNDAEAESEGKDVQD